MFLETSKMIILI